MSEQGLDLNHNMQVLWNLHPKALMLACGISI